MFTARTARSSRKKKAIVAGIAAVALVSGTAVATALPGNKVGLMVADNAQLDNGVRLLDKTLQAIDPGGAIYYIYLESNSGNIQQVSFFLEDQATGQSEPISVDNSSPYVADNMSASASTGTTKQSFGNTPAAATTGSRTTTAERPATRTGTGTTARAGNTVPKTKSPSAATADEDMEETEESTTSKEGDDHAPGTAPHGHLMSANAEGHEPGEEDAGESEESDSEESEEGAEEETTTPSKSTTRPTTGSTTDDAGSTATTRNRSTAGTTTGGTTGTAPTATSPRTTPATGAVAGFDTTGYESGTYVLVAEITAKAGVFELQSTFAIDNVDDGTGTTRGGTTGTGTTEDAATDDGETSSGDDTTSDDGETSDDSDTASDDNTTSGGGTECEEFAGGDTKEICQGPMDGEAGEIQAYVAELIALLKDEEGMKAAGLFLDPGSSNHYQVYASEFKKEWPSSARIAHLVESGGKIKGAQIDTSGNPDWMNLVPNSGGDSAHTHMDGKGGYWHDPH